MAIPVRGDSVLYLLESGEVTQTEIHVASKTKKQQDAAFFLFLPSAAGGQDDAGKRPHEFLFA